MPEKHSPMEMLGSITVDTDSAYDLGTTAKRFANIFADVVDTPIVDLSMTQGSVLFIDSNGRIAQDNTNFFWDDANNRLGIGIASPDGTLHVHTGSAGAVTAAGNADDLVVEVAGAGGISILTPDGSNSQIFMGSPSDTSGVIIKWNHTADLFTWGTSNLNAQVSITSGNGVEAVRINSSGNFDFKAGNLLTSGVVSIGTTDTNFKLHVALRDDGAIPSPATGTIAIFQNSGISQDDARIQINSVRTSAVDFGDDVTGAVGSIQYNHDDNDFSFRTNSSLRLIIDSSGLDITGRLFIDGSSDTPQLQVQGHSTQTNPLVTFEQSDGTDVFTVSNSGNIVALGTATINSTLVLATGSITDTTGAISFGNENLTTTGSVIAESIGIAGAPITKLRIGGNDNKLTGPIMTFLGDAANQFEAGRIRFTELVDSFLGGYMHWDGGNNILIIGVHNDNNEITANDVQAIVIRRTTGKVTIINELEMDGSLNHDGSTVGFYGTAPAAQSSAYTRNATIVEDRTLLASASATILNNNNVLAALIADLQAVGLLG